MSSPSPPSPDPAMPTRRQPSCSLPRVPAFSVRDFEQLVSDAFDSPPTPTLALTPAPPTPSESTSAVSPGERNPARSYFDDTDDDTARLCEPRTSRASRRPRSQSFSSFSVPYRLPSSSPSAYGEQPSRLGTTRRVLRTLRARASALVLRPSAAPHGAATGRDTPASFVTLSSRTSTSTVTARPLLHQPSRYAFPSGVDEDTAPESAGHAGPASLDFLRIPPHSAFDGPRSAPTPSISDYRSKSPNPTLLGDLVSANRCNTPTSSTFTRSPSLPPSPPTLHVHARLPPLKQSRSFNLLSRHDKKLPKKTSLLDPTSPVPSSSMAIEFEQGELPSRCSSPYTNPRPPPPVPLKTHAQDLWREEDLEQELEVPSYVFERRGSATSDGSSASVKSTQTLAERIAKVIPRSLRMAKGRNRSKLNLSVITSSSSDSAPNSFDTSMTFSSSGYSASMPPTPYTSSFYGTDSSRRSSVQSETMMVPDRVLTPEEDPFKKRDIEVPLEVGRTRTPMPADEPPSPPMLWMERQVPNRAMRKTSSGSRHAHTNSGDTITALTSGMDRLPSPMDILDRQFVFPRLPSSSRSTPSPTPTSYWSPVSLRSTVPLPPARQFLARITTIPPSPPSSTSSSTLPSPGPPPNIPLPPSPTPPSLRTRISQESLRVATLASNKDAARRLGADRPPSPFPLTTSASGFGSWAKMSTLGRDEHVSPVSELGEQLLARTALLPRSASVRSARSDPGMRARPHATKHARATSDQPCASDETLTEIEERWEGETSRSTTFYSARSSMLSGVSTVFGGL